MASVRGRSLSLVYVSFLLVISACGSVTTSADDAPGEIVLAGSNAGPVSTTTGSSPALEVVNPDTSTPVLVTSTAQHFVSPTTPKQAEESPAVPVFAPPEPVTLEQKNRPEGVRLCTASELVMTSGEAVQSTSDASGASTVLISFEFRNESNTVCRRPLTTMILVYDSAGEQRWGEGAMYTCLADRECQLLEPGGTVNVIAEWEKIEYDFTGEFASPVPPGRYSAEAVLIAQRSTTPDLLPARPEPDGRFDEREYRSGTLVTFDIGEPQS
ncbi:MAG: hypothetical protein ACC652_10410 [Acidimicrobiales bacterium]